MQFPKLVLPQSLATPDAEEEAKSFIGSIVCPKISQWLVSEHKNKTLTLSIRVPSNIISRKLVEDTEWLQLFENCCYDSLTLYKEALADAGVAVSNVSLVAGYEAPRQVSVSVPFSNHRRQTTRSSRNVVLALKFCLVK